MMVEFGFFILQGIPEMAGLVGLSLALAGIPLHWGRILTASTLLALVIYLIRVIPGAFGLHSIAGLLLLIYLMVRSTSIRPSVIIIAVFISYTILAVLEMTIHEAFFFFTNMELADIIPNHLLWLGIGMPQAVLLILFALLASKLKQPQRGAWKI